MGLYLTTSIADPSTPTTPRWSAPFGCGAGWAPIALAADLPDLRIAGIDNDEASGPPPAATASNTTSPTGSAWTSPIYAPPGSITDRFDVIFIFECVHGFPRGP